MQAEVRMPQVADCRPALIMQDGKLFIVGIGQKDSVDATKITKEGDKTFYTSEAGQKYEVNDRRGS